jgi:hypothetical protein
MVNLLLPAAPKWVPIIAGYLSDPLPHLPVPPLTGMASRRRRSAMVRLPPLFHRGLPPQLGLGPARLGPW